MNKQDLVASLSAQFDVSKREAGDAVDAVFDSIAKAVAKGDKVAIPGFGSFEKRKRAARTAPQPADRCADQGSRDVRPGVQGRQGVQGSGRWEEEGCCEVCEEEEAVRPAASSTSNASPGRSITTVRSPAARARCACTKADRGPNERPHEPPHEQSVRAAVACPGDDDVTRCIQKAEHIRRGDVRQVGVNDQDGKPGPDDRSPERAIEARASSIHSSTPSGTSTLMRCQSNDVQSGPLQRIHYAAEQLDHQRRPVAHGHDMRQTPLGQGRETDRNERGRQHV